MSIWDRFRIDLGLFWASFRQLLERFWDKFGTLVGHLEGNFESIVGNLGTIIRQSRHECVICGSMSGQLLDDVGQFWDNFGIMVRQCWENLGVFSLFL